jgi:hypothetical protein
MALIELRNSVLESSNESRNVLRKLINTYLMLFQSGSKSPNLRCYAISGRFFHLYIPKSFLAIEFKLFMHIVDFRHGTLEDEM